MDLNQFQFELRNNSVKEYRAMEGPLRHGRRNDGKWVLEDLALNYYHLTNISKYDKDNLIDDILECERINPRFTNRYENRNPYNCGTPRRSFMNLAEFQTELETNSVKENHSIYGYELQNGRRTCDGKWVLEDLARYYYNLEGVEKSTKNNLISRIIRAERENPRFTRPENRNTNNSVNSRSSSNSSFEITVTEENQGFRPYTINIHVRDKATHDKLVRDVKRARSQFCSEGNWILTPLENALGIK